MFTELIESRGRRRRPGGQSVASVVLHLAVGVGMVHATRSAAVRPEQREILVSQPIVIARPHEPEARSRGATSESHRRSQPTAPVLAPPVDLPITIPPVDPTTRFDPATYGRIPLPGGRCDSGCHLDPAPGAVFLEAAVDEPARVESEPAPEYPPLLQRAGIGGRVTLEFVVDSLGRVEPGSVRVVDSVHPAFARSAERAVSASRFLPARIRGRSVRQLVRQSIDFRLEP